MKKLILKLIGGLAIIAIFTMNLPVSQAKIDYQGFVEKFIRQRYQTMIKHELKEITPLLTNNLKVLSDDEILKKLAISTSRKCQLSDYEYQINKLEVTDFKETTLVKFDLTYKEEYSKEKNSRQELCYIEEGLAVPHQLYLNKKEGEFFVDQFKIQSLKGQPLPDYPSTFP